MKNIVMQSIRATMAMGEEGQDWLDGIYKKICDIQNIGGRHA